MTIRICCPANGWVSAQTVEKRGRADQTFGRRSTKKSGEVWQQAYECRSVLLLPIDLSLHFLSLEAASDKKGYYRSAVYWLLPLII